jgi:hypothetical protein
LSAAVYDGTLVVMRYRSMWPILLLSALGCSSAKPRGYPPFPPPMGAFVRFDEEWLDVTRGTQRLAVFRVLNLSERPVYYDGQLSQGLAVLQDGRWTNVPKIVCRGPVRVPGGFPPRVADELAAGASVDIEVDVSGFAGDCRARFEFYDDRRMKGPSVWVWTDVLRLPGS